MRLVTTLETTLTTTRRAGFAAVSAAVAALALTACGGEHGGGHPAGHDSGKKTSGDAGSADVAFAQGMIPHHRQAVEMSALAASRAESAEVKSLAKEISGAQQPEIEKLSGWLKSWGKKVPGAHEGHGGHHMHGMMTPQDMAELKKSSGKDFDRGFLTMMTAHHEGAVQMSRTEEADGSYPQAKKLAGDIRRAQTREIKEMRELLKEMKK